MICFTRQEFEEFVHPSAWYVRAPVGAYETARSLLNKLEAKAGEIGPAHDDGFVPMTIGGESEEFDLTQPEISILVYGMQKALDANLHLVPAGVSRRFEQFIGRVRTAGASTPAEAANERS